MVSDVASQQGGPGLEARVRVFLVTFACLRGFSACTPASSHSLNTWELGVRLIGPSKLSIGVNVIVDGCLYLSVHLSGLR